MTPRETRDFCWGCVLIVLLMVIMVLGFTLSSCSRAAATEPKIASPERQLTTFVRRMAQDPNTTAQQRMEALFEAARKVTPR